MINSRQELPFGIKLDNKRSTGGNIIFSPEYRSTNPSRRNTIVFDSLNIVALFYAAEQTDTHFR